MAGEKRQKEWKPFVGNRFTTKGEEWSHDDTAIALYRSLDLPFGKIRQTDPVIEKLAKILKRGSVGVAHKMRRMKKQLPEYDGAYGKIRKTVSMERAVLKEFLADSSGFKKNAEILLKQRSGELPEDSPLLPTATAHTPDFSNLDKLPPGKTGRRLVEEKFRINQDKFRKQVLSAYCNRCCITGINLPELLVASHILPWRDYPEYRTDPRNGLCLNSLHDRAFDRGLISVSSELIVAVSPKLQEVAAAKNASDKIQFLVESDGKPITQPEKFAPAPEFLAHHYRHIFQR